MSTHQLYEQLHDKHGSPLPTSGKALYVPGVGYLLGWGPSQPSNGETGWAKGALFLITVAERGHLFVNTGTVDSCVFGYYHATIDNVATYALPSHQIRMTGLASFIWLQNSVSYIDFGPDQSVRLWYNTTAGLLECGPKLGSLWSHCPLIGQADMSGFYHIVEDFMGEFDVTTRWTVTEDDAACTQALTATPGGTVLLTNKATTDDNAQQLVYDRGGAYEMFKLATAKNLWFEARVKCAAGATQNDVIIGLVNQGEDLTGVADNMAHDGVVFHKDDGATTIKCTASKDGTNTGQNANVGTLTTGWHTYGFYADGKTSITPYFDGTAGTALTATICDDEALCPLFLIRNGDGTTTQTMEIDYVKVVQLR